MTQTMTMPKLTRVQKVNYGLGSTAEAIAFTATSSFLLIYYNQVIGLPAGHVGTALAAGLIVNALFDPLVGSWSDRTRSRFGRRHPFMFAAIIPAAALFWAVFNPPDWGEVWQLVWLAVCNTMLMQAMTLYHTPHLALGGEMSNDYLERTSIMGFNTVCLWLGDSIAWVISFRFFFASTEQFKNGALDPTRWPFFSASFAIAIFLLLAYSSWSTRRFIPYLPKPDAATPGFGLKERRTPTDDHRAAFGDDRRERRADVRYSTHKCAMVVEERVASERGVDPLHFRQALRRHQLDDRIGAPLIPDFLEPAHDQRLVLVAHRGIGMTRNGISQRVENTSSLSAPPKGRVRTKATGGRRITTPSRPCSGSPEFATDALGSASSS